MPFCSCSVSVLLSSCASFVALHGYGRRADWEEEGGGFCNLQHFGLPRFRCQQWDDSLYYIPHPGTPSSSCTVGIVDSNFAVVTWLLHYSLCSSWCFTCLPLFTYIFYHLEEKRLLLLLPVLFSILYFSFYGQTKYRCCSTYAHARPRYALCSFCRVTVPFERRDAPGTTEEPVFGRRLRRSRAFEGYCLILPSSLVNCQ